MKLVWTRLAHDDRRAVRDFIAADNLRAALALDELFSKKINPLADHPGLGRPGRVEGTLALVVHRNFIVVYDIAGAQVRILRILHAARQWPTTES